MSEIKLLIANDSERTCRRLERGLQAFGYSQTTIAARYEDAFRKITAEPYDAVLLDLFWPEGGHSEPKGIDLLIAAKTQRQDVFAIVFSDNRTAMWRQKVLRAGADEFLHKPLNIENIITLFRKRWPDEKLLPRVHSDIQQRAALCLRALVALLAHLRDQVEAVNHFALFQEYLRQLWAMRRSREEEFAELVVLIESVTEHAEPEQFTMEQINTLKDVVTRLGEPNISRRELSDWRRAFRRCGLDIYRPLYNISRVRFTITEGENPNDAD